MNEGKDSSKGVNLSDDMKALVIARIDAQVSSHLKLSIGSFGSMNKEEMIEHVQKGDEIGKQIAQVHLAFLKAQASGALITALNSVE